MLSDIPYKKIVDFGRKYDVWVLRDVYGNTFADIAREYGVSVACILNDYQKILSLKSRYYINHLSIVYGYQDTENFKKIWIDAINCYYGKKYVVAYFEKEYADVLSEYRQGEPGMPEQFLRDLPPFRNEFSKQTVSSIIRLRETNGMTYAAIGKRLHMTKEKAENLYNHHYHILFHQLSEKLMKITGDIGLHRRYQDIFQVGSGKKRYDRLVNDYPELCKDIIKPKKQNKNIQQRDM